MMPGTRIDFASADPARFNQLRDDWRRRACGARKLPKIAVRVAGILPDDLNRAEGFCFPTDDRLAEKLDTSKRNIGKGMKALEEAEWIERATITKRDQNREAIGKLRRIYLTEPGSQVASSEPPLHATRKSADRSESERNTSVEVNGTEVNGTPEVNGTVRVGERNTLGRGERNDGVPNTHEYTPDKKTPDKKIRSEGRDSRGYAREVNGTFRSNPYPTPKSFGDDLAFLDAFDHEVRNLTTGQDIGAGEIDRITERAFDAATNSDDDFMPFLWADVCQLRTGSTADWFRWRCGSLIHRSEAA